MIQRFQTLTLATCTSTLATTPTKVAMVDNVISVVFDKQLRSNAAPPYISSDARHVWHMAVVDVHLPTTTRRPFVVKVKAAMSAFHGHSSVRISIDGRTSSRQLFAGPEPQYVDHDISLHIRRSTHPRDRLRLHVWVEATAITNNGVAEATVDTIDLLAR